MTNQPCVSHGQSAAVLKTPGDSNAKRPATQQQGNEETEAAEEGYGALFLIGRAPIEVGAAARQTEIGLRNL